MAPKDNAKGRTQTAQGAHRENASFRAADWHVYRSASAGPVLLHIPTSRLFSITPALADYLSTTGEGRGKGRRGRVAAPLAAMAVPLGDLAIPSRPVTCGRAGVSPANHTSLRAALAELERLCQPPGPGAIPVAHDDTCATASDGDVGAQGLAPRVPETQRSDSAPRWANLTVFITDRCNLHCAYCFESYRSLRDRGRAITRETAAAALDFFFERLYPDAEVYDLHLFGGEPLLAWDMVEWITLEGRRRAERKAKPLYMSISTNAIGLTAKQAAFLREHEFAVSVSFDGPPEVHDQFRRFSNGRGSFAAVCKALAHLSDGRPPYVSVAGRLHRGNTDVFNSFLAAYEAVGGKQGVAFTLARLSPDHPLRLREEDVEVILASYRRLVDFLVEQTAKGEYGYLSSLIIGNDYLGRFIPRLKTRSRGSRRCEAGLNLFVVGTDGELYPCRSLVGLEQYRLGDIQSGIDPERHEPWLHLTVEERDDCKTCWARYLCGGGCYAQAAIACGTPARPNPVECRYTRGLMELTMELIARLGTEAPAKLDDALADIVANLPEKHRIFVPPGSQHVMHAPRIVSLDLGNRIASPGDLVRLRLAVKAPRPVLAVSVYDSTGGARALRAETAPADSWPQTLWFCGEEQLGSDAPIGKFALWAVVVDETGATTTSEAGYFEIRDRAQ